MDSDESEGKLRGEIWLKKESKKISLCPIKNIWLIFVISANLLPLGRHAVNPLKKWLFMYCHPPMSFYCITGCKPFSGFPLLRGYCMISICLLNYNKKKDFPVKLFFSHETSKFIPKMRESIVKSRLAGICKIKKNRFFL